jgi:CheY-like chemotaxis protein
MNVGKILVVDDEKFNCDIIEGFLMILGYQGGDSGIVFAYNGEQAVKEVQKAIDECDPYRFSLILMDCNMPFLDGYEATKRIRRALSDIDVARDQQPRIVAITGHVENEYVEKALKSGMDKVYPKPLPVKEFGQLLIAMKFIEEVPKHLELDSNEE